MCDTRSIVRFPSPRQAARLAVTMGLWGLTVVARALVNAGRMAPLFAAALPLVALSVALAVLLWVPPGAVQRFVRRGGWSGARA